MKYVFVILAIILLFYLFSNTTIFFTSKATVIRVIDGDTIEVKIMGIKKTVRLIGVDTPETVKPNKPIECFGKEASDKTKELLLGKEIILKRDITQNDKDVYGRLLRYVYLENGTLLNYFIVREGYAYEYTFKTSYLFQKEFKEAEQFAKQNNLGLWKACKTN